MWRSTFFLEPSENTLIKLEGHLIFPNKNATEHRDKVFPFTSDIYVNHNLILKSATLTYMKVRFGFNLSNISRFELYYIIIIFFQCLVLSLPISSRLNLHNKKDSNIELERIYSL